MELSLNAVIRRTVRLVLSCVIEFQVILSLSRNSDPRIMIPYLLEQQLER